MGPIRTLSDIMSLIRRRKVVISAIFAAGLVATIAYALSLPATFEASTLIQLRSSPIAGDTNQLDAARRVQVVEQRLMRREGVAEMIERHGLFAGQQGLSSDDRVLLFRKSVDIRMIDATGGSATGADAAPLVALLITARAGTAEQAAAVANDLAASLMRQDRDERTRANREALSFLTSESDRLSRELRDVDERIGAIKRENEEALPAAAEALRAERAQLRELQLDLERQALALDRERLTLELRAEAPDGAQGDQSLAAQMSRLTNDLAQSRRLLPASHPEIKRLEAEIAALRKGGASVLGTGTEREVALVDSQRDAVERQKAEITGRQVQIESALDRAPVVEQQLSALERRQSQLVSHLSSISQRLSEVQSRRSVDEESTGASMTVLETAQAPDYPLSSSRKRVAVLGAAASLAAALLAALILDLRHPIMRSTGQVQRMLGVAPIASAPYIPSAADRSLAVAQRAAVAVIFLVAAGVIYQMMDSRGDAQAGSAALVAAPAP